MDLGGSTRSAERESRELRAEVTSLKSELTSLRLENRKLKSQLDVNAGEIAELKKQLKAEKASAMKPVDPKGAEIPEEQAEDVKLFFRSGNLEIDMLAAEFDWKGLAATLTVLGNESESLRRSPKCPSWSTTPGCATTTT